MISDVFPASKLDISLTSKLSAKPEVLHDVWRTVECDVERHIVTRSERRPKRRVIAGVLGNV